MAPPAPPHCPSKEAKNVFVSSANRNTSLYPNGNSYTLHFIDPVKNIKSVELLYVSVPNTIYNVSDGSNVISVSNVGGDVFTFSIPPGFYSSDGIATELQNAVRNKSNVSVEYLNNEGKFLLSTGLANIFTTNVHSAELSKILGFPTGIIKTASNVGTDTTNVHVPLYADNTRYADKNFIVSPFMANIDTDNTIFLDIEELRTPLNQELVALDGIGSTMTRSFGIVPIDGLNMGVVNRFRKSTDYNLDVQYPYPIQRLDRLTVSWVNKDGKLVNFNGNNDNSFLLRLHTERTNIC